MMNRTALVFLIALTAFHRATAAPEPAGTGPVLTLEQCMARARELNPRVLTARSEMDRTEGIIRETRADALPQLGFQGHYTRVDPDSIETIPGEADASFPLGQEEEYEYGFGLRQLVYSGGRVGAALRAATLGRDAAQAGYDEVLANVLLEVRLAFYEILLKKNELDVQRENIRLLEEQLDVARSRFKAGRIPKLDLLRAEVALANGQPTLIKARNDYRIARERLAELLMFELPAQGARDEALPAILGDFADPTPPPPLDEILRAAFDQRPELRRLRLQEEMRSEGVAVASAGNKPTISLGADYGWRSSALGFDEPLYGWRATAWAEMPIFNGFRTSGQVQQARAQLDQARLQYRETRRKIELQVRTAYGNVLEALKFVESQKKNAEQAEEALRLAQRAYEVGTGTQLDVLNARLALTVARSLQVRALYSYSAARTQLEHAIGRTSDWLPEDLRDGDARVAER